MIVFTSNQPTFSYLIFGNECDCLNERVVALISHIETWGVKDALGR